MGDATAADVGRWAEEIDRIRTRLGSRFTRPEVRTRIGFYLRGLLAGVERKNAWRLAEFAGDLSPTNVQHFIGRAVRDADAIRDELRAYVIEHLGKPDGVLILGGRYGHADEHTDDPPAAEWWHARDAIDVGVGRPGGVAVAGRGGPGRHGGGRGRKKIARG